MAFWAPPSAPWPPRPHKEAIQLQIYAMGFRDFFSQKKWEPKIPKKNAK